MVAFLAATCFFPLSRAFLPLRYYSPAPLPFLPSTRGAVEARTLVAALLIRFSSPSVQRGISTLIFGSVDLAYHPVADDVSGFSLIFSSSDISSFLKEEYPHE